MVVSVYIPEKIWIEYHESENDSKSSCDVLVKIEEGNIYTAHFVTLAHLRREMDLSYAVTRQIDHTPAVRYATLEHPHLLVDDLSRDNIEDIIENLIALSMFGSVFTQVTDDRDGDDNQGDRTAQSNGTRTTQELAAVVLSDVLVVESDD